MIEIWNVAWPSGPLPCFFQKVAPGMKLPHARLSWVWTIKIHTKILKQSAASEPQVLAVWDVALPSVLLPSLMKWKSQDLKWLYARRFCVWFIEVNRTVIKTTYFLLNLLAKGLEIWYVTLPRAQLPSLFKWWHRDLKWPKPNGIEP